MRWTSFSATPEIAPCPVQRVELVVDDDDLDFAVALDQRQPFARSERADE
jgi:hypothetical protein